MLEAIGGRKFVMAFVMMLVGVGVELAGKNGLTVNMAGFLVAVYTAFAGANMMITNKAATPESETPQNMTISTSNPMVEQALSHLVERQAATEQAAQTLQASVAGVQKTLVALLSKNSI